MVEVIHRQRGIYPFGLEKPTENTFVCLLRQNLTEQEIAFYRQKSKILREITSTNIIRLHQLLKQDNNVHLHFEYFPNSLEMYIESIKHQTHSPKDRCKSLLADFNSGINSVIEQLVKIEIRADFFLRNFAVVVKENDSMHLMAYIEPQSVDFLSLMEHQYRPSEGKRKDKSTSNQQFLQQFYQAERKRLNIQFQQLLQHHFGKVNELEKRNMPNFVINGTKLMFLSNGKDEAATKSSKIDQKNKEAKDKMDKKLEEHRKINQQVEQKLHGMTPSAKTRQESANAAELAKRLKIEKIVNFDQSFEPQFKPEEFVNQKTYIFEENDYLESLEEQLVKLASDKKLSVYQTSKTTVAEKSREENSTSEEKKINDSQKSIDSQREPMKASNAQHSSGTINQNKSNSNVSNHSNEGEGLQICKIQPKETAIIEEKVFKYKMKIITSHEIEIEGDGEPNVEQIEREIMEGIKTGKLNINDLASNKRTTQVNQVRSAEGSTSNDNSREMSGSTHTQKSATAGNFLKEAREKIVQSSHEGNKKESFSTSQPHLLQTRSSDLQQNKMRSINEIIERIGIRTNQNQASKQQSKTPSFKQSSYTEQTKQGPIPTAPHFKTEKMEVASEKVQRADNYLVKIREAKDKAELILRQYARKKQ